MLLLVSMLTVSSCQSSLLQPVQTARSSAPLSVPTLELKGVRTITVVCRVNGKLDGDFATNERAVVREAEAHTRKHLCRLVEQLIKSDSAADRRIKIVQRPDGRFLKSDHLGIMVDAALDWKEKPFKGFAMAVSLRTFRYIPNGPPGVFFYAKPDLLLFEEKSKEEFNIEDNLKPLAIVIQRQIIGLSR
jgi:hypothetical protein